MEGSEYPNWFVELVKEVGLAGAIMAVLILILHFWIFRLYTARVKDRQIEIDRLADDNREYRDRFLAIMDERFNYEPPKAQKRKKQ